MSVTTASIIMQVRLAAKYCLPVDNDYRIGIVKVENNKLR